MNNLAIFAIVVGVLVLASVAFINAYAADNSSEEQITSATCTSCGNSCTAENNCGLTACGAVNGGTCGCGR